MQQKKYILSTVAQATNDPRQAQPMPSHKPSLPYPAQEISTPSITFVQGAPQNISIPIGGSRSALSNKSLLIDCSRTTNIAAAPDIHVTKKTLITTTTMQACQAPPQSCSKEVKCLKESNRPRMSSSARLNKRDRPKSSTDKEAIALPQITACL